MLAKITYLAEEKKVDNINSKTTEKGSFDE